MGRLTGVLALSSSDAWAVGATFTQTPAGVQYAALIEHWDGTSWSVVPDPDIRGTSELNAIAGRSASAIWAVGWERAGGATQGLAEYWDGVDWRTVPTQNPPGRGYTFSAVAEISPTDAWAVGGGQSGLAEHWDGTAWKLVTTPSLTPRAGVTGLAGVAAFGPRDVWAVGGYISSAQGGTSSFAENWDGRSWSIVSMPDAMRSSQAAAVTVLPDGSPTSRQQQRKSAQR